ncbi:MAG TPA: NusG domain II-containing protein [Clostridiaceae bacterium]|nr:NusG domain II-containing protein [Clostridiaceae bacterium]
MKDKVEETRDRRVFIRSRDLFVLVALVAVALILYFVTWSTRNSSELVAKIYYDGQLIEVVELNSGTERDFQFDVEPSITIRQFADKSIAFMSSDCPDRICIKSGRIRRAGEFAACVPNRFLIVIEGADPSSGQEDVDLVA